MQCIELVSHTTLPNIVEGSARHPGTHIDLLVAVFNLFGYDVTELVCDGVEDRGDFAHRLWRECGVEHLALPAVACALSGEETRSECEFVGAVSQVSLNEFAGIGNAYVHGDHGRHFEGFRILDDHMV